LLLLLLLLAAAAHDVDEVDGAAYSADDRRRLALLALALCPPS